MTGLIVVIARNDNDNVKKYKPREMSRGIRETRHMCRSCGFGRIDFVNDMSDGHTYFKSKTRGKIYGQLEYGSKMNSNFVFVLMSVVILNAVIASIVITTLQKKEALAQPEGWATFDELDANSPQMKIISDLFNRLMNGSEHITMILYSDGRVEIRHEDMSWREQDTTIRTVTNYTISLGYEIRDGIVYNPNGTVLFQ
jgi:hypothetical protein